MRKKDFPDTIYVTQDGDKGEEYLIPWDTESASETDGDTVAIYTLSDVKKLRVVAELV